MSRYSIIHGTDPHGEYNYLYESAGIQNFLESVHISNSIVIRDLIAQLSVYSSNGAKSMPKNALVSSPRSSPTGIRYAPMHLQNQDTTRGALPFCVLSFCGPEHRKERETSFYHSWLIDYADLVEDKQGISGFDRLFGGRITTWQDIERIRNRQNSSVLLENDIQPCNVYINDQDRPYVIAVAKAIFEDQDIFIRLEDGVDYDIRALEILQQVYSLLPPRLMREVGFATCVDAMTQLNLKHIFSCMRIFVFDQGISLPDVASSHVLLVDLNQPAPNMDPNDKLARTINWWCNIQIKQRREAFGAIFSTGAFQDAELFLSSSARFSSDPFFTWLKDLNNSISVRSIFDLPELLSLWKAFPLCGQISWAKEQFCAKIYRQIVSPKQLSELMAQLYAYCVITRKPEWEKFNSEAAEKLKAHGFSSETMDKLFEDLSAIFPIGVNMLRASASLSCSGLEQQVFAPTLKDELDKLQATQNAKISELEASYDENLQQQKSECEKVLSEKDQELNKKEEECKKQLEDLQNRAVSRIKEIEAARKAAEERFKLDIGTAQESLKEANRRTRAKEEQISYLKDDLEELEKRYSQKKEDISRLEEKLYKAERRSAGNRSTLMLVIASVGTLILGALIAALIMIFVLNMRPSSQSSYPEQTDLQTDGISSEYKDVPQTSYPEQTESQTDETSSEYKDVPQTSYPEQTESQIDEITGDDTAAHPSAKSFEAYPMTS